MFNQIKEDPQMENEPQSPAGNSTRTLGIDSEARAKLYGHRAQQDYCLLMNFT